jgi:predicted RNA-binding protein YlxR (DUF448 family)
MITEKFALSSPENVDVNQVFIKFCRRAPGRSYWLHVRQHTLSSAIAPSISSGGVHYLPYN